MFALYVTTTPGGKAGHRPGAAVTHPVATLGFPAVVARLTRLRRYDGFVRALVVVALVELVSWLAVGPRGLDLVALGDDSWRVLLGVEPIPPMPLYMLTGTATATLVILGSIELGE